MKKRKIIKDRQFPDSNSIRKYQDFNKVKGNFSIIKKILVKKIIIWTAGLSALAGIATVILLQKDQEQFQPFTQHVPDSIAASGIHPPIPGAENPFAIFRVNANDPSSITYSTGSVIEIPAKAFCDVDGHEPEDTIEIKYREYHDPLEIFLSGIPMVYDSAGLIRQFESAGMLQILAFEGDKALYLKKDKKIEIKMVSKSNEDRFNLYDFDTIKNNWVYQGKDVAETIGSKTEFLQRKPTDRNIEDSPSFLKPELANPAKYAFKISYDKTEFPELSAYEHVMFEVTGGNFKPAYYKINWNKIAVYGTEEKGVYTIKLRKADTTINIAAKPVFELADYEVALHQFESAHQQQSLKRDRKELENQLELQKVNQELLKYNNSQMVTTARRMANITAFRTIPISSLGLYNSDYPMPPIVQYAYSFKSVPINKKTDSQKDFSFSTIFVVVAGKNAVLSFPKGEAVHCDPTSKNLMWTITDKKEIAFFRIEDFSKLKNGGDNFVQPIVAKDQISAFVEIRKFSGL